MDITKTRSKRRNTLYPRALLTKKKDEASNNKQTVEVIKHFEPSPRKSCQTIELPHIVEDDDDSEGEIVEGVAFQPSRHRTPSTQNQNEKKLVSKTVSLNPVENVYQSAQEKITERPLDTKKVVKRNDGIRSKTRSRQASPSSSSPSPNRTKGKENQRHTKRSPKTRSPASQLPRKAKTLKHGIYPIQKTEKHKPKGQTCPKNIVCTSKTCPNETTKKYSFVTSSYIRSLKDEIQTAPCKNNKAVFSTATDLKTEIKQFRNAMKTDIVVSVTKSKEILSRVSIHMDKPEKKKETKNLTVDQNDILGNCSCSPVGNNKNETIKERVTPAVSKKFAVLQELAEKESETPSDRVIILEKNYTSSEEESRTEVDDESENPSTSLPSKPWPFYSEDSTTDNSQGFSTSAEDVLLEIEPTQSPMCPILLRQVESNRTVVRCIGSEQQDEQTAVNETCTSCTSVVKDEHFMELIAEQNKNIKTFAELVIQVESLIQSINGKIKHPDVKSSNHHANKIYYDRPCKEIQASPSISTLKFEKVVKSQSDTANVPKTSKGPKGKGSHITSKINPHIDAKSKKEEKLEITRKSSSAHHVEKLSPITEDSECSSRLENKTSKCSNQDEESPVSEIIKLSKNNEDKSKPVNYGDIESFLNKVFSDIEGSESADESKSVGPNNNLIMKNCSNKPPTKGEGKLVIQMMPPINIQRGLVTQKIPSIIIPANESLPEVNVSAKSNILYEAVKHDCESSNKLNQQSKDIQCNIEIFNSDEIQTCEKVTKNITSDTKLSSGINETSPKCTTKCISKIVANSLTTPDNLMGNDEFTKKADIEATEEPQLPEKKRQSQMSDMNVYYVNKSATQDSVDTQPTASNQTLVIAAAKCLCTKNCVQSPVTKRYIDESNSEYSSVPSCDYESRKYISHCLPHKSKAVDSVCSKLSRTVEQLAKCQKDRILKRFVNELIEKDPQAEAILQSYQLLTEKSGHDPEHEVDEQELSYIDKDIYQTFVNPEGLKYIKCPENKETNTEEVLKVHEITSTGTSDIDYTQPCTIVRIMTTRQRDPSLSTSQFGEHINVECDDNVCGIVSGNLSGQSNVEPPVPEETPEDQYVTKKRKTAWNLDNLPQHTVKQDESETSALDSRMLKRRKTALKMELLKDLKGISDSKEEVRQQDEVCRQEEIDQQDEMHQPDEVSLLDNMSAEIQGESSYASFELSPNRLSMNYVANYENNFLRSVSHGSESAFSTDTDDIILEIKSSALRRVLSEEKANNRDLNINNGEHGSEDEYIITRDISAQTSLLETCSRRKEVHGEGTEKSMQSLKEIVQKDTSYEDKSGLFCCTKPIWRSGKKKYETHKSNLKKSSPEIFQRSLLYDNSVDPDIDLMHRKSVTIEEPLQQRLLSNTDDISSFITALTFDSGLLGTGSKSDSIPFRINMESTQKGRYGTRKASSEFENFSVLEYTKDTDNIDQQANETVEKDDKGIEAADDDKVDPFTVMAVIVEQPNNFIQSSTDSDLLHRSDGGDHAEHLKTTISTQYEYSAVQLSDNSSEDNSILCHHYIRSSKEHKRRNNPESGCESRSESISDETEELLSEGEIKCKSNVSIGEVHTMHHCKRNIQSRIDYLKRHPQNLLAHELGDPNIKIRRKKTINSNWVAYYISRSSSPDTENRESSTNSKDSSGLFKK